MVTFSGYPGGYRISRTSGKRWIPEWIPPDLGSASNLTKPNIRLTRKPDIGNAVLGLGPPVNLLTIVKVGPLDDSVTEIPLMDGNQAGWLLLVVT